MVFQIKNGSRRPIAGPAAASIAAGDAGARESAAILVVSMGSAGSGLLMGLCLAGVHWPALAFVFGAVLAGAGAWFARGLAAPLMKE